MRRPINIGKTEGLNIGCGIPIFHKLQPYHIISLIFLVTNK